MLGFLATIALLASLAPQPTSAQTMVTVQGTSSHAIPETLCMHGNSRSCISPYSCSGGLMFEDISVSSNGLVLVLAAMLTFRTAQRGWRALWRM